MNFPIWSTIGGLLAALGASLCCAGPMVLLILGVSGSWITTLTEFAPLRPYFIIAVLGLFAWAGWNLYRPINSCPTEEPCTPRTSRHLYQLMFWIAAVLSFLLISSPYWIGWLI